MEAAGGINNVMTGNQSWQKDGLGSTGKHSWWVAIP